MNQHSRNSEQKALLRKWYRKLRSEVLERTTYLQATLHKHAEEAHLMMLSHTSSGIFTLRIAGSQSERVQWGKKEWLAGQVRDGEKETHRHKSTNWTIAFPPPPFLTVNMMTPPCFLLFLLRWLLFPFQIQVNISWLNHYFKGGENTRKGQLQICKLLNNIVFFCKAGILALPQNKCVKCLQNDWHGKRPS